MRQYAGHSTLSQPFLRQPAPRRAPRQLICYMVVGAGNTVVEFSVLNLLLWLAPAEAPAQITLYSTLAYVLSVLHGYFWHRRWTFEGARRQRQRLWRYALLNALTLGLNGLLMYTLTSITPLLIAGSSVLLQGHCHAHLRRRQLSRQPPVGFSGNPEEALAGRSRLEPRRIPTLRATGQQRQDAPPQPPYFLLILVTQGHVLICSFR